MKKIEILGQVITSEYGVLNCGDVATVSDEMASYLVGEKQAKECKAVELPKIEAKPKK